MKQGMIWQMLEKRKASNEQYFNATYQKVLDAYEDCCDDLIGIGFTALVYARDGVVKKVFLENWPKNEIFKEAYYMASVEAVGIECSKAISVKQERGFWIIEMTEVKGVPLLGAVIGCLQSGTPERVAGLIQMLGSVHAKIVLSKSKDLPNAKKALETRLLGNPHLADNYKSKLHELLNALPDGNYICHGDYNPGNVVIAPDGSAGVIDWADVQLGDSACDVAMAYVNMKYAPAGLLPPNAAEVYLDALLAAAPEISKESVMKWVPVHCGWLYGIKGVMDDAGMMAEIEKVMKEEG